MTDRAGAAARPGDGPLSRRGTNIPIATQITPSGQSATPSDHHGLSGEP